METLSLYALITFRYLLCMNIQYYNHINNIRVIFTPL